MEDRQTVQDGIQTQTELRASLKSLGAATPLQRDILRTLSYFDIFQHPLTAEEIYSFLPSNSTNVEHISQACLGLVEQEIVGHQDGYYAIGATIADRLSSRREKELHAAKCWQYAVRVGNIIRHIPFVKGVYVSGELSKGVASLESDIDFFIITAEHRLWICRSIIALLKRIYPPLLKQHLCFNLFITEKHLEFEEQNIYSAIEIATLKPLSDHGVLSPFLKHNQWVKHFLPNYTTPLTGDHTAPQSKSFLQSAMEFLLSSSPFTSLDRWLMRFWKVLINKRYARYPKEQREQIFFFKEHIGTGYNHDLPRKILDSYERKLSEFQLSP